jgi:two-component system phosphate regulon sensor histidine kinase PhoR
MIEIILSLLLSLSIVGSLFYLLRIINRQKRIDEIKNDLISNITHEFKTPITTISSAIEGIKNFNSVNDPKKTNRYLDIASQQLEKLANMVEKLLETASLESDNLKLSKEPLNIVQLLKTNVEKHLLNTSNKTIDFISNQKELILDVDAFHFENAISNLIDNALKYGGNQIEVCLKLDKKMIEITVQDNGIEIDKNQHEKIFEKFYRIPKGNIHDVKGFGIGLYYSKKIIEKHQGTLELIVNSKNIFKITLTHV